ncbi:MAG: hypothetical protein JWP33_1214 [Blastococcus sp.]|jgi:hypothetical protein|nr:hypothetical protein [Blastococcus sp.]
MATLGVEKPSAVALDEDVVGPASSTDAIGTTIAGSLEAVVSRRVPCPGLLVVTQPMSPPPDRPAGRRTAGAARGGRPDSGQH